MGIHPLRFTIQRLSFSLTAVLLAISLLSACSLPGGSSGTTPSDTQPDQVRVNGFGTAANHVHSLVALPDKILLLATHYGLFRSQDDGANWTQVAGGNNQLMQGLMTYSLDQSHLNPQRFYVLTQPAIKSPNGTPGLYTSTDQGRTWKMVATEQSLTSGHIYLAAAGNDTADQVYIYLNSLGNLGLKMSQDGGEHFTTTGTLPFALLSSLLVIPGAPGHLLASSSDGLARSTDGGEHWEIIKSVQGGIFDLTTAGPKSPIYASGDNGVYASQDGGQTFNLVYSQSSMGSLTSSAAQPATVYGKTGTGIYRSTDGGQKWEKLPAIKGNFYSLTASPADAQQVYLSLNYPVTVYRFTQAGGWVSLTPKP